MEKACHGWAGYLGIVIEECGFDVVPVMNYKCSLKVFFGLTYVLLMMRMVMTVSFYPLEWCSLILWFPHFKPISYELICTPLLYSTIDHLGNLTSFLTAMIVNIPSALDACKVLRKTCLSSPWICSRKRHYSLRCHLTSSLGLLAVQPWFFRTVVYHVTKFYVVMVQAQISGCGY